MQIRVNVFKKLLLMKISFVTGNRRGGKKVMTHTHGADKYGPRGITCYSKSSSFKCNWNATRE